MPKFRMEFFSAPALILALLVFFAGLVDSLAGGGGLITVPAYLAAGVPPYLVLGTNKLVSSIGTSMAVFQYHRKLKLPLKPFIPAITASLIGSAAGAGLTLFIPPNFLRYFLLLALPALLYWMYFQPHGFEKTGLPEPSRGQSLTEIKTVFPIGAYDGFFGPGTGTFFALALNRFCHYPLLEATARTKILNLASNAAALATFLIAGRVHLQVGLAMAAANVAGNYLGAKIGVHKGAKAIRPAILLVCSLLFIKTAWDLARIHLQF